MSLKRYATLLAFGQHQSQSQNQNHTISATTTSVAPTTDGISSSQPSSSPFGSFSSEELMSQSQEHISSSSSIATHTTYYTGGLGQYHQQRGGSGSVISGVGGGGGPGGPQTYANVVNGNVNLLLGGSLKIAAIKNGLGDDNASHAAAVSFLPRQSGKVGKVGPERTLMNC